MFAPGTVAADYRFDSWRATWRWRWIDREDLKVKVGVTAKIRDASIQLRQGGVSARKENTGFVPLLHGAFERRLAPGWALDGGADNDEVYAFASFTRVTLGVRWRPR